MRFFQHEDAPTRALDFIPLVVRRRLDEAGVRISLAQWQALPLPARHVLALMENTLEDRSAWREALAWVLSTALPPGHGTVEDRAVPLPWRDPVPPTELVRALAVHGRTLDPAVWAALDPDARYALVHGLRGLDRHPERFAVLAAEILGGAFTHPPATGLDPDGRRG